MKDLTKNETVTRDLSDEDRDRMQNWPHGLHFLNSRGVWKPRDFGDATLFSDVVYRAIPAPVTVADEDPVVLDHEQSMILPEVELSRQTRRADAYRAALRGIALTADCPHVKQRAKIGIKEGDAE